MEIGNCGSNPKNPNQNLPKIQEHSPDLNHLESKGKGKPKA
jgi:hypothetical protein